MKVLIIGSGGREHSLCLSIKKSKKVNEIFCIPGNAGTKMIAKNYDLDLNDFKQVLSFIKKNDINIVIIGPEKPLVKGLVNFLEKNHIKVFGPNQYASRLEGSKIFTKKICDKFKIPTAKYKLANNKNEAFKFLIKSKFPIVVKADGLASGKGVYICNDKIEYETAINEIFDGKFGKSKEVLIEEFLNGEEMSFFIISDGKTFKFFGTAQDHKKIYEGDKGKNTGGMGAYSPSRLENIKIKKKIIKKIIEPTLKYLKNNGNEFKGFLYAGLMIVKNEPYLIEYNVRMGDPECQTILPRLKTDFFEIIKACLDQKLDKINIEWSENLSLCIVLCSKGYPDKYKNNLIIKNLKNITLSHKEFIFHAGTKMINRKIFSNGGRVLNFTVISKSFKKSRSRAINLIKKLNWSNGFFRKDIGYKVIEK
ncbi:phosphoribosylamine--glycine ligase [Candidatus Pelagibacter sp.]|nr:phosphoribosylamine--glycine ligase [Candidatus Pelagibacter sp.]